MDESSLGFLIAFLLPFHVGGGAALGIALRRIFSGGFKLSNLAGNGFLLVWGATFGGIPLLFGLSSGMAWFVALQLAVLIGSIIAVAVFYEQLRDLYRHPGMFLATFGLVFFVVGAALTVTIGGEAGTGLLVGLIFAGVGGLLTLGGVWALLKK